LESVESSAATLLTLLHDTYNSKDTSATRQRRSIELLLKTLAACRPTDEDKKKFAVGLMASVIKTGKQEPAMRDIAIEVLKKIGPGEH
jgi:hypothetical protein